MDDNLLTPFEKKVSIYCRQCMKTLRDKGCNPEQLLKNYNSGGTSLLFPVITWALAETMLFVEIIRLHARNTSSEVINFIEATEIEDDDASDDDAPFSKG